MLVKQRFKVYEYPIKGEKKSDYYFGSYTIKEDVKPLGFKGERIVSKFTALVIVDLKGI